MTENIAHDPEKQKFYAVIDGKQNVLEYYHKGDSLLDFVSTYVHPDMRGHGIASEIVKKGLDYAKENEFKVKPSCPFVYDFIKRHPEYEDIMAN